VHILLTGFEPFGPHDVNPSWDAASALHGAEIAGARVAAVRLPVAWGRAPDLVVEAAASVRPALVLLVGLAAGSPAVRVEHLFVNLRHGRDSDGAQAEDAPVAEGGPVAIAAGLPVAAIVAALRGAGIPAVASQSAGTYICNGTAYAVAHRMPTVPSGLLHVPATPDLVARQQARAAAEGREAPVTPSMALALITEALRLAVEVAVHHQLG